MKVGPAQSHEIVARSMAIGSQGAGLQWFESQTIALRLGAGSDHTDGSCWLARGLFGEPDARVCLRAKVFHQRRLSKIFGMRSSILCKDSLRRCRVAWIGCSSGEVFLWLWRDDPFFIDLVALYTRDTGHLFAPHPRAPSK